MNQSTKSAKIILNKSAYKIDLTLNDSDPITLTGEDNMDALWDHLYEHASVQKSDTIFEIFKDADTPYGLHLQIMETINSVVATLRDAYCEEHYGVSYDPGFYDMTEEQITEVTEIYPSIVIDH